MTGGSFDRFRNRRPRFLFYCGVSRSLIDAFDSRIYASIPILLCVLVSGVDAFRGGIYASIPIILWGFGLRNRRYVDILSSPPGFSRRVCSV